MLLRSALSSCDLIEDRVGSSSWKKDSCTEPSSSVLFALLQAPQGPLGRFDDFPRHPGHPGDVDAEAVGHATFFELAQEYDFLAGFLDRDMEILDPGVLLLEVV